MTAGTQRGRCSSFASRWLDETCLRMLTSAKDRDEGVKQWLIKDSGAEEDSLPRYETSPRDGDELGFLSLGTRPEPNSSEGPWFYYPNIKRGVGVLINQWPSGKPKSWPKGI